MGLLCEQLHANQKHEFSELFLPTAIPNTIPSLPGPNKPRNAQISTATILKCLFYLKYARNYKKNQPEIYCSLQINKQITNLTKGIQNILKNRRGNEQAGQNIFKNFFYNFQPTFVTNHAVLIIELCIIYNSQQAFISRITGIIFIRINGILGHYLPHYFSSLIFTHKFVLAYFIVFPDDRYQSHVPLLSHPDNPLQAYTRAHPSPPSHPQIWAPYAPSLNQKNRPGYISWDRQKPSP